MVYTDDAERFISTVKPIINKSLNKYMPYIRGYTYDDLYQEGLQYALEARAKWNMRSDYLNYDGKKIGRADLSILAWTKRVIIDRYKELTKITSFVTCSIDDETLNAVKNIEDESANKIVDMFFNSGFSDDNSYDDFDGHGKHGESLKLAVEEFLENTGSKASQDKFLSEVITADLSPLAVAEEIGVTESRVSQLKSKINVLKYK